MSHATTTTSAQTVSALERFHTRTLSLYRQKNNSLPVLSKDDDWPSPCEQGDACDDMVFWKPVSTKGALSFDGLESALRMTLHPDIRAFFGSFYSHNLSANSNDGDLDLLQAWNSHDFDRLQENLIGHIMAKRKRKQAETVFIAVTDDDEIILSVINETGEVWAERVGQQPHRKVADSLVAFLDGLSPSV